MLQLISHYIKVGENHILENDSHMLMKASQRFLPRSEVYIPHLEWVFNGSYCDGIRHELKAKMTWIKKWTFKKKGHYLQSPVYIWGYNVSQVFCAKNKPRQIYQRKNNFFSSIRFITSNFATLFHTQSKWGPSSNKCCILKWGGKFDHLSHEI